MKTIEKFPAIGFVHLGPDMEKLVAQRRAWQLSHFMRTEVHGPVYEDEFRLRYIDPDPRSGTVRDMPWRIRSMRGNNTLQPNGSYREYIVAFDLDEQGNISDERLAIAGILVITKDKVCSPSEHTPAHIAEIDVARRMRGQGLASHMMGMAGLLHPEDPAITLDVYEGNVRARSFYTGLGFTVDQSIPPEDGAVYEGKWIAMHAPGEAFMANLQPRLQLAT